MPNNSKFSPNTQPPEDEHVGFGLVGCLAGPIAAILLFYLGLGTLNALYDGYREWKRRDTACAGNLKRLGKIYETYAADHGGLYPPLEDDLRRFTFDREAFVRPEYLAESEMNIFICPRSKVFEWFFNTDAWHFYLGYALPDEETAHRFLDALEHDEPLDEFTPLQSGLPNAASIPVMVERRTGHETGGNVLYLDGHVEFVPYPDYPMTQKFSSRLWRLTEASHVYSGR